MLQTYIGNTKINKLYKGSDLWCNWSSGGGDTPIEPSTGYVTDNLIICCDAYGKSSADSFDGFYDTINNRKFVLSSGSASYETNCLNINGGFLVYGLGTNVYASILKKTLKNTSFELVFKCGSYTTGWRSILTMGNYNPSPFAIKSSFNAYGGNKLIYVMNGSQNEKKAIRCLDKTKFWNHLIVTIGNDCIGKIYVNGQYLSDYTINSYEDTPAYYGSSLYFGYSSASDVPLMSIGCFRYYHKALTETEVLQNYNHEQTINRATTLNFPALDDSYEKADPPIIEGPGEISKGGNANE